MKEITLQEMLSTIIGELRENGRWGTAHIYQSTLNVFSAFNNYRDLHLRKLNPVVLKRFEMHLRQRDCSWNTVSTYMKVIRSAYNRAVDLRCVRYTPRLFEHVYTGTKADKKRALEASDIGTLVRGTEMDLSKRIPSSSLQKAKMLFVFMFMMRGLPFVDLAFLHKKDLQGNVLSYRRRKTGRTLRVLLSPEALQLVHMVSNKDENSPYLFPILRSKDGTEAAYKEYQSALRRFNYQLSALKTHLNMSSHLSSYSARHTWATMAYYCEIHPGIISEAMGHSSITVTETYLKPFKNKKIDEANATVLSPFRKTLYGVEPGNNTFYICFGRITVYYGKYRKPGRLCSEQQPERFWRYLCQRIDHLAKCDAICKCPINRICARVRSYCEL